MTKAVQMNEVSFDSKKLTQLKQAYDKALESGEEYFWFENRKLYIPYAGYLIEYLEGQLQ